MILTTAKASPGGLGHGLDWYYPKGVTKKGENYDSETNTVPALLPGV